MIQSKLIKNFKNISHGFFNSQGGYSKGIYKSLNCGIGSKDKKINVKKNIKKVCKKIGCSEKNLILLNQKHSNKVRFIYKNPKKKLEGDSSITNKRSIASCQIPRTKNDIFIIYGIICSIGSRLY